MDYKIGGMFVSWIVEGAPGNPEEAAFLQQMATLAEAATNAARAAERALQQVGTATSSAGGDGQSGLQAAVRILKSPDAYNGEDPCAFAIWKFGFTSWLSHGEPRYQPILDEIENAWPDHACLQCGRNRVGEEVARHLVLYLKGKCIGVARSLEKSKDGFKLCVASSSPRI